MKKVVRRLGHWLCLVAVGGLSAPVQAQEYALVTDTPAPVQSETRETGKTLKQTLSDLETRFKVHILYNVKTIENKQVSGKFSPADGIENILEKLLEPHQLRFEKLKPDVYVIVMPKSDKQAIRQIERENLPAAGSTDMASLVKTINLNLGNPSAAANAEVAISGRVVSADDNSGLPGVSVVVKGTTTGTVTDGDGRYKLNVPGPTSVLVFSFVGYLSEEATVGSRTTIDMKMAADIKALSEVVVVGYGTQKKKDITGAMSSISAKEISELPITNAQQALQGRAPGVDVSSTGGRPGQGVSVRIRGRRSFNAGNEPLYVVDGIPLAGDINDINPQDIQSMEILKDASATAIYGSRGANGVVLITTKRGTSGRTTVSYDGYFGLQNSLDKIDVMNGEQFAEYKRESRRAAGRYDDMDPQADQKLFEAVELESIGLGRYTDYQDLIARTGTQQSHQIGVLGGSEKTRFAITANHFYDKGITPGQDFSRNSLRINLDHQISDRFSVGASMLGSFNIQNWGPDPWGGALAENPLGVPYDENGNLKFRPTTDGLRTNPLSELVEGAIIDENRRTRIFASLYGEYKILDGLTFRMNIGPDLQVRRNGIFRGSLTGDRSEGTPFAQKRYWTTFAYTMENILNYTKTFGDIHSLNVTGLFSIQKNRDEFLDARVSGLPYEYQQFYNLGSASNVEGVGSNLSEWGIVSYMGRINYGLKGKYLLTLTGRIDGSSRFAGDVSLFKDTKKYGFFPSVAVGWLLSEENFLKGAGFVSNLKLRASYGITGNTGISPYSVQGRLQRTTYAFGSAGAFGYRPDAIPNPELQWESTAQANIGLDYGFFNDRISGSVEVYQQNTTDLLMQRQLPWTSGYGSVLQNIGATRNTGIEFAISTVNLDLPNSFRWSTDLNIFSNKEEIVSLYGGKTDDIGNRWFIGKPMTVYYDLEKTGIWQLDEIDEAARYKQKPGEIKVRDQNNDGVINNDDRILLGSDIPDWSGGITNRFEFKGIDFSFFLFARRGQMIRSLLHNDNNNLFGRYNNLDVDYWTPPNPNNPRNPNGNPTNAFPRPNFNQERPTWNTSMQYFDGSFLKIRNVTLGYNFPEALAGKMKMQSLRVYVSAQQPLIFSPYINKFQGIDPERVRTPDNGRERTSEVSFGGSPSTRLFLFGLNAKF
jgi:TonB-linked SusC/RagA family outer membrane protein